MSGLPAEPVLLTLDTSVVNARGSLAEMNRIERWHREGRVEIHAPPQVLEEILNHRGAEGRALYAGKAAAFRGRTPPGQPPRRPAGATPEEIARLLFPHTKPEAMTESQRRDAEILSAHHRLRRDIFVTLDTRHFIRAGRRERLAKRFGIRVMTPAEFLLYAREELGFEEGRAAGGRVSRSGGAKRGGRGGRGGTANRRSSG